MKMYVEIALKTVAYFLLHYTISYAHEVSSGLKNCFYLLVLEILHTF